MKKSALCLLLCLLLALPCLSVAEQSRQVNRSCRTRSTRWHPRKNIMPPLN